MAQGEIAKAIVDLDGSMAGAELKKLESRARELRSELTKLGKDNDLAGFKQKEKELKLVNQQMKGFKSSTDAVEATLRKLNGSSFNELTRAQRALNAEIHRMTTNTKEEITAYNEKISKLKQVNAQLTKLKQETGAASAAQQSWLSKAAGGFNKYFAIVSAGIATFTGVVFSIKSLVQGNLELDDALADVMKTTGLTKKEVRELHTEFKNLNTRTPRKELLALAEEAGRLGIEGKKKIMDFVEVANQIKVALGDDLAGNAEEAIREVGKLTEIYRVGQKYGVDFKQSMLMVGSAINEVSANSSANAPFLIDMTKRLAGVSSQAGIGVQDIIGYAAALDEMGQTSEVSATTLNKVIVSMFKDTQTYSNLAKMGVQEFTDLLKTDANEAFIAVLEGLQGNNEGLSVMAEKLDGLGLDGSRSIQILAALASNVALVRKEQDLANVSLEQGTSLTQEYQVKNNNMAGGMEKIGRAIRGAFINSGINEVMSKLVTNVAKWIEIPVSKTMEDQRIKVNMLTIELTNSNTQEQRRKDIWKELQGLAPEILNGINQESINIDLLRQNMQRYNEEAIRKIALQRASEELTKIQDKLGSQVTKRSEAEFALNSRFLNQKRLMGNADKELAEQADKILLSDMDILDKYKELVRVANEYNDLHTGLYISTQSLSEAAGQYTYELSEENKLLEDSNKELGKYQEMYKSIMGTTAAPAAGSTSTGGGPEGGEPEEGPQVGTPGTPTSGSPAAGNIFNTLLDQQAAFRMRIINEAKSLVDQENLSYRERLANAGIYFEDIGALTEENQQVFEILELQHQENLRKINDQALSDDLLENQKNFDQQTVIRQTAHNNEMAALGNNDEAKKALEAQFQKEELERQQAFLQALLAGLQQSIDGSELSGIDEKLLTEEQKEALKLRIEEVKLMLSELGIKLGDIQNPTPEGGSDTSLGAKGGSVDVFGMSQQDWENLLNNLAEGNFTLEDTLALIGSISNAWSMVNDIRKNQEDQAMMDYESDVIQRKELLKKQLDYGLISQESYNKQVNQMDNELDKKKRELAIKQAKREKAMALVSAIVNTAAAIVSALKTQPVWLGIVMAALVGFMGGLQIATIASEPIPQFAKGKYGVTGAQDGRQYNAGMIDSAGTGLIHSPAILVGEKPEIIIDPPTTRNLQINYPWVIDAINNARIPQFATGSYTGVASKDTAGGRELPKDSEVNAALAVELRRLNDQLHRGIPATLVADGSYIITHNKVAEEYDSLKNQASLGP